MNHLMENWPDEPDRDKTEKFARNLQARLPQLPTDALPRIEQRLQLALSERPSWLRRRRGTIAAALAASVLAALFWMHGRTAKETPPPATEVVHDTMRVTLPAIPAPVPTAEPLVVFEAYQGLYTN